MDEFRFELALCSHLESETETIVARQLGGAVARPGARVVDIVVLQPGDQFDMRARLSPNAVPTSAIESDVGAGQAVPRRDVLDGSSHARRVVETAVEAGYFQIERRDGREWVRATARYPEGWYDRLTAIENKPDLAKPGDLERQLTHDVTVGLFDEVVMATNSHVTRAHLNRIPDAVGVWQFDPETGERTVVRDPSPLPVDEPGVEPVDRRPLRTDVAIVGPEEKRRRRLTIAERAYGKGWRPKADAYPECTHVEATEDCRPYCSQFDRVVDPGTDCGTDCPAFERESTPTIDPEAARAERSPWIRDPPGALHRQVGLDRFG
ncbi:hypothetical protein AArcSl_2088 [Halalkaliarchaeum desulfuricum]|uniref:Uncharacterized protein n=1 Tax=Halalkaliarchaeum desulfuricum TaxID=2055893 RepID=A0A343TKU1_9EURY|nr:DUF5787 family protein [Halalkaliarchaeum desulfuricum]AUX09713.1 hypothetical protein AArcSl_2088 [Halalkaliarchaeum desulfuricum]